MKNCFRDHRHRDLGLTGPTPSPSGAGGSGGAGDTGHRGAGDAGGSRAPRQPGSRAPLALFSLVKIHFYHQSMIQWVIGLTEYALNESVTGVTVTQ